MAVLRLNLAFAVFSGATVKALDLTPHEGLRFQEGVPIPVLTFSDPTGQITYQPPGAWTFSGGGASLVLLPPALYGTSMKMMVVPHASGLPDIMTMPGADLVKWGRSFLAGDADDVKLLGESPNAMMVLGKPNRELLFDYKSSARRYQTSITILDWSEREHFAVIITALASDFKAVHDMGAASMGAFRRKTDDAAITSQSPPASFAKPAPAVAPRRGVGTGG